MFDSNGRYLLTMKCLLYIANAPLSQDYRAGGAVRYTQAFDAMQRLGSEVHIVRLLSKEHSAFIQQFESNLSAEDKERYALVASWTDVPFAYRTRFKSRSEGFLKGLISPLQFAFPEVVDLMEPLNADIKRIKPDLMIAQMLPCGAVAAALRPALPWIYGHHDWRYRLRMNRLQKRGSISIGGRFTQWALRRGEESIVRECSGVIAASNTEAEEVQKLGVRNCVAIPSSYRSVPPPEQDAKPSDHMRIVHLGVLSATSLNSEPMIRYLDEVSPHLPSDWEFVIVGALDNASDELIKRIRTAGAKTLGFVPRLEDVLRPFDVAVLPYNHNTGERTRVAQLFNHCQVVVTTRAAVEGSAFLQAGHNCVVVDTLSDFPSALQKLADNPDLRRKIGLAAKATFEEQLTLEAQLPLFKQVIDGALEQHQTRRR